MSRDTLRARLAAYQAKQPYTFSVGNRVFSYDPVTQKSTLLNTRPLTDQDWRKEADGWHNRKRTKVLS